MNYETSLSMINFGKCLTIPRLTRHFIFFMNEILFNESNESEYRISRLSSILGKPKEQLAATFLVEQANLFPQEVHGVALGPLNIFSIKSGFQIYFIRMWISFAWPFASNSSTHSTSFHCVTLRNILFIFASLHHSYIFDSFVDRVMSLKAKHDTFVKWVAQHDTFKR